jgi:hypothetical protein
MEPPFNSVIQHPPPWWRWDNHAPERPRNEVPKRVEVAMDVMRT